MKNIWRVFRRISALFIGGWMLCMMFPFLTEARLSFVEMQQDFKSGLKYVRGVAMSPNGASLYTAGGDHGIGVFSRNTSTGELTFVEWQSDTAGGEAEPVGTMSTWDIVVSPEGTHVYAVNFGDDKLTAFDRNNITGELTFISQYKDGIEGISGMSSPWAMVISSDGKNVYTISWGGDAIAVFSRNASTGALTFVEKQQDGVGNVDGLDCPRGLAVSPDGASLYATGTNDDSIVLFERDTESGALTFIGMEQDGVNGVSGLNGARSVFVSLDNEHVYATSSDNAVVVFDRDTATGELTFVEMHQDGIDDVDGLDGAGVITCDLNGEFLYIVSSGDDAVAVFSRDTSTGELTFVEMRQDGVGGVNGLDSAWGVVVSPYGNHLYVTGTLDHAVNLFSRNGETGKLSFVREYKDSEGLVDGLENTRGVTVSPDGAHVYVAGTFEDKIAVFSRNEETGALTFVEKKQDGEGGIDGLKTVFSLILSHDGNYLYAAGANDHAISVFSRNSTTGSLTFVEMQQDGVGSVDGLNGVITASVSPDDAHLYAVGMGEDALAVFSRNTSTGKLSFIEMHQDNVGTVDGLDDPGSVTISPDGKHVYVTGNLDNAIAIFSRDAASGMLTFEDVIKNGDSGISGLGGAWPVAVSPDGNHIYVAGSENNTLVVFSRDADTGALTFVEQLQDDINDIDGLNGVTSIAISPNGTYAYTSSIGDDAIAVFARDLTTGTLQFLECRKDGENGIDGLNDAWAVSVSPDEGHAYVSGANDNAIAVFAILLPEIAVRQGATPIPKGTGSYDFGTLTVGSNYSVTFTVDDSGTEDLNLTGTTPTYVVIDGDADFSVELQPDSTIIPGGSTTFEIKYAPESTGSHSATIRIDNDDADRSPYTFTITGTGEAQTENSYLLWTK